MAIKADAIAMVRCSLLGIPARPLYGEDILCGRINDN